MGTSGCPFVGISAEVVERCFYCIWSPQLGTIRRQQLLQCHWHFSCQCQRCLDPTEFGTMANSLKCFDCPNGYLVPNDPTNVDSDWHCLQCLEKFNCSKIMQVILDFNNEFEKYRNDIEKLESLLESSLMILHPNHFLLTGIRESLIKLLLAQERSTSIKASQKLDHYRHVVSVMVITDPVEADVWTRSLEKMEKDVLEQFK